MTPSAASAHSIGGEQRAGDGRIEARRQRLEVEVGGGEDGDHVGHRLRLGGVDGRDRGVGDRRADVVGDRRALERHLAVDT
jgi:hypothetical protein